MTSLSGAQVLPTTVRPLHYDVDLVPDLDKSVYDGVVSVDVHINTPTSVIVLNAREIAFKSVTFTFKDNNKTIAASDTKISDDDQTASFMFSEDLAVGEGVLRMVFTGILNNDMVGFYASKYEKDGQKKIMATTQFEAVYARRAIPCWDEPLLKATFTVHLTVDEGLTAVSNMPVVKEDKLTGGKVKYSYDRSPVMSTYLLAFVIGEFEYVEATTKGNVKIRVYTPVGNQEQGKFGLDVAVKSLDFYDKYFEIPYPLPKLDMLAIPDFAWGAMENWGCVTYRTTALLVDPKNTSAAVKQWVALVIAHELAHQWFGNLVTMEWWTHLWLNEGFASWVEYLAINEIYPDWKVWTQFVYQDQRRAMSLDSLKSSHPVEVPVKKAQEVDEIFDSISYSKGASIIRMLVAFLGEEDFRKGMVLYLNRHKYKNASTEDLWKALGDYSNKDVKQFMDRWTKTMGYPVLSLSDDIKDNKVPIIQSWFLADGSSDEKGDEGSWHVPVKVTSTIGVSGIHLLKEKSAAVPVSDGSKWFKLNSTQEGLYRVHYTPKMIAKLKEAIVAGEIKEPLDRLGLELDAFALARAGKMSTADVLSLVDGYQNETDFTVWADVSASLGGVLSIFGKDSLEEKLNRFVIRLYSKIGSQLGWEGKEEEDHLTNMLRSLVIPRLGKAGHEETVAEACRRFNAFIASGYKEGLAADLRSGVYAIVMKNGGRLAFEALLHLYRTAGFQEEKVRALGVLSSVPDDKLFVRVLEMTLSDEIRKQDIIYVYRNLGGAAHLQLAWEFVQKNWEKLVQNFGETTMLGDIVKCFGEFTQLEKAIELEKFFANNTPAKLQRTVQQTVESIKTNTAWLQRDKDSVEQWLDANLQ